MNNYHSNYLVIMIRKMNFCRQQTVFVFLSLKVPSSFLFTVAYSLYIVIVLNFFLNVQE